MSLQKASIVVFVLVALLTAGFMWKLSQGEAAPSGPTDGSKVPHYFGPNPNWALSPLTSAEVTVTISGDGVGATAAASVGANGAVTDVAITNPGSGYSGATVAFTGAGTGAVANAVVTTSTAVSAVNVDTPGSGYKKPVVTFTGGGFLLPAAATAYGGVDVVTVDLPGVGYTFPTVDFDAPDDPAGIQAVGHATMDGAGAITAVIVDNPGSGYSSAPGVVVRDGTAMDPINNAGSGATAHATLRILSVGVDDGGSGYTSAPAVGIADSAGGTGSGATATSAVKAGTVSGITLVSGGSGYVSGGGIRKFVDALPGLCDPASVAGCPTAADAKYIPLGVPESKAYLDPQGRSIRADEYEIAVVQYRTRFSSSLPAAGSLARGYVQLETPSWLLAHPGVSQHIALVNELRDGTSVPVLENGVPVYAVTRPQWLGPTIVATKNKPVRIVFHNLLPTGVNGNLFIPTDTTLMGSGNGPVAMPAPVNNGTVTDEVRNPVCTDNPQDASCFKQNRATLHLHGGVTPWISDGTPHQWITPANENTAWPQGVSVQNVPDMNVGNSATDGIQTFYYTNQQSARLMFYHDHAWGITRLNVYAGEAAGYLITDNTEKALIANGTIPGPADTIPLIVQDKTFVPQDSQLFNSVDASGTVTSYGQDPTWDKTKWGSYGDFWYHHVYMPAQNPGDPSGMSSYGRWMYGPWFWPPASTTVYGPIVNPYYNASCNRADPATWQYQVAPYCEPAQIPGTPNISVGMEQFNDTPIVNGEAYPTVTLEPKSYRLRILNAANDRFFNFQWYVADTRTASTGLNGAGQVIGGTEVALDAALLAAAQTDPTVFPTPDTVNSAPGPDWIQMGSEGGFLPAPTVVNGHQPITWITDATRFDFGNVDKHSLVLGPAERADVIVDFSKYAGKTLILYNDAPAAYPARIPSYDYYTGAPNLSPVGAPGIMPGYGPNTRTVMQVKISGTPAAAFNLTALRSAFSHKANGSGVFEASQPPIIVGQAAYNSAYGTSFSGSSNCNALGSTLQICDGLVRVSDTMTFGFNTLKKPTTKTSMPLQPKAMHDEMNATTFDDFGRMQATLGIEAQPPTPGLQNVTLYPYINPQTELIDGTNLPKNMVTYDADGNPVSDLKIAPMSDPNDGTQIWRITHNGVDTHPLHFHLYDVQILNRVTWDNIIIPTEASELGWKETIRVSPLEDTIVALRPIVPDLPWELPNAIRNLNPGMPTGDTTQFNNINPQGQPTNPISNQLVNFGWEYVYHCHILSHEEMDMMRPVTLALPPLKPSGLAFSINTVGGVQHVNLSWSDNSINETAFVVQKTTDGTTWADVGTIVSPLDQPNVHQTRSLIDPATYDPSVVYKYRVIGQNQVAYGAEFPSMTVQSVSDPVDTGTYTITPTAGAGGTITPGTPQSVALGGSKTFTIAANAGYHVADVRVDGVSNPGALASGTYTFTGVTANHTISALFEANPALTIVSPISGTFTQGSSTNVTFTLSSAVSSGTFRVWLKDNVTGTWVRITPSSSPIAAVAGKTSYTVPWSVTQPLASYRLWVYYYGVDGTTVLATKQSSGTLTIVANSTPTIVTPNSGTFYQGSSTSVTWTMAGSGVSTGMFRVWLKDNLTGAWVRITPAASPVLAVAGQVSYTVPWTVTQAAGNYRLWVYYYAADGTTVLGTKQSSGTITVAANPTPTIVTPNSGTFAQGGASSVTWAMPGSGVSTGSFRVWLRNTVTNAWVRITPAATPVAAVAGQTSYTVPWSVTQPKATYRLWVYYYAADGTTVVGTAQSTGVITIN